MLSPKEIEKLQGVLGDESADFAPIFSALSDLTRCNIFRAILARKSLCVTDIVNILDISMPSASQHLKILESKGLLTRERKGREIYYSPNSTDPIVKAIEKVVT
jgi:DNA-binding transcriptional ArsR family regulator